MRPLIGVVDYGLGNLTSVLGALDRLGCSVVRLERAEQLFEVDRIILPGVGAFGRGMENLSRGRFVEALRVAVKEQGKSLLGICLGMQLLADESEEFGRHEGLGLVPGRVVRLHSQEFGEAVPHVGWNDVSVRRQSSVFDGIAEGTCFYHVHSYHLVPRNAGAVAATCIHGHEFVTAVSVGTIFGVQFHPEKSQSQGLRLLGSFANGDADAC